MANFELNAGENIIKEIKGDYWEKSFLFMYDQKRGSFCFTNERIMFRGGFSTTLNLPYSDIVSISKCNVGPMIGFIPTGISVTMRDGKSYRLSVLKRSELMELIQSKIN